LIESSVYSKSCKSSLFDAKSLVIFNLFDIYILLIKLFWYAINS